MPRKPKPTEAAPEIDNDIAKSGEVIEQATNEMAEHSQKIMEHYGAGATYDREYFFNKCADAIRRTGEEALTIGRCLVIMKEHEPHGEWSGILERLSFQPRAAQKFMQAAVKFSNAPSTAHLIDAAGSKTKLFELMLLDDEDIKELNDGGTVAGIDLDDVAKMSCSELRQSLRDARKDLATKDAVAETNHRRINELQEELVTVKARPVDETALKMRAEINGYADRIEQDIRTLLSECFVQLQKHSDDSGISETQYIASRLDLLDNALSYIRQVTGIERTATDSSAEWEGD